MPLWVREPRPTDGVPEAFVDSFTQFATANEGKLRQALIATCGGELGREEQSMRWPTGGSTGSGSGKWTTRWATSMSLVET